MDGSPDSMRRHVFVYRGPAGAEEVTVELDGARCVVTRGSRRITAEARQLPDGRISLLCEDGRQLCGRVRAAGEGAVEVSAVGGRQEVALADPLHDRLAHSASAEGGGAGEEEIRALMPGRVLEVAVSAGDAVEAGALLLVLEAMKMQNEIRAPRAGRLTRVEARPGTAVEGGTLLATIGAAEA
jgi:biotin carboxyl carrier protein